jgi:hypothetical protein
VAFRGRFMVWPGIAEAALSLSDPRTRRNDGKLLNGDPLPPDDARRAQIERDWKFIERLRWAILTGRESPTAVLGVRNKRPS